MKTKKLIDNLLPSNDVDLAIQAGRIVKLISKGPSGSDVREDDLIASIFEIGLSVVKDELCKRCEHVRKTQRNSQRNIAQDS